eukprot:SAG22_NODE_6891_length_798_cov_1.377682_1_plen_33_part_10
MQNAECELAEAPMGVSPVLVRRWSRGRTLKNLP